MDGLKRRDILLSDLGVILPSNSVFESTPLPEAPYFIFQIQYNIQYTFSTAQIMSFYDTEAEALARVEYWDERYAKSDGKGPTHEWFRSYSDLQPFLEKYLFEPFKPAQNPKILHLGAGDSVSID